MKSTIEWTRVNNDVNGNPRHVCHYLAFIGTKDKFDSLDSRYALALSRAHALGGRKFHNKQYGGGIVFQAYGGSCLDELTTKIHKLVGKPGFVAMSRRATVLVKFHATNGNNDNRWSVTIRDYPRRYYDCSIAEHLGIHGADQAEYFAEKHLEELGLTWIIQASGTLPTGEAVFTV